MAGHVTRSAPDAHRKSQRGTEESPFVKWCLIAIAAGFLTLFLLLPLINVFAQAFSRGIGGYLAALRDPDTLAAIRLTLYVAAWCVPLNLIFGLAASWCIAKFQFRGKSLLISLID